MIISFAMGSNCIVYAETLKEDITFKNDEFEIFVNEIVKIKESNHELSEQEIEEIIDKKVSLNRRSTNNPFEIWGALTNSEKKLVIKYPLAALDVNKAKNVAIEMTMVKFESNGLGSRSDAFRHGLWNAVMTKSIGREKAELFATAHEDKSVEGDEADGYAKILHKEMDLHNNEVGRDIGTKNLVDEQQLATIIYEEIYSENSSFIWLHE